MFRVSIVGRPNVGKSTLFNRLTRSRRAIVGDEPGITRDRIEKTASWNGRQFQVVDTGGLIPEASQAIPRQVLEQAEVAMSESDLTLLVVDVRSGITPLDESLNALLRSRGREYLLVVNKVDVERLEEHAFEFYSFGVSHLYPVSAEHNLGIGELVEAICARMEEGIAERGQERGIRTAIIGRPNVGKSSLTNRLLGQERVIVTPLPGTTRDSVDTRLQVGDQVYTIVDTAGIRRKGRTERMAEKLSVVMARKSLERADVVLLVLDATEGATHLDATIGGYADRAWKSVIVVVNKWDLVERDTHTAARLEKEFRAAMRFLDYAPMIFVSALTGQRVNRIFELVAKAWEARRTRVSTSELNQFLAREVGPLLTSPGRRRKFPVKYASQVGVDPPTFVFFTRTSRKLHFSTRRFLVNRLRGRYGFWATPIRIVQRSTRKA